MSSVVRRSYARLPVPSADLSHLVRVRGNTLMALTTGGAFEGQTYPVRSNDDGASWLVDGPRFNGSAASGGSQVDHLSACDSHTLFAWGGNGGTNAWTRPLNGAHWRQAPIGSIRRGWCRGNDLLVASGHLHQPAVEYVSTDAGRTWNASATGSS